MNKKNLLTIVNWGTAAALFTLFLAWHGAFEGPLSGAEVEQYVAAYLEINPGADTDTLRSYLENDDGKAVVMINVIKLYDEPLEVNGERIAETSEEVLGEYMKFVIPFLLRRGSYPLFNGTAVMDSLEKWGIENAEQWSSGSLLRYRSRRVMMEMATDPSFQQFHEAKIAAIEKTFAFPTSVTYNAGSLPVTVALVLLVVSLIMQLFINKQKGLDIQ